LPLHRLSDEQARPAKRDSLMRVAAKAADFEKGVPGIKRIPSSATAAPVP
jgi:hypothetical protein